MLLKGIIMIFFGSAGIVGTIMWFVKSIRKADRNNGTLSYKGEKVMTYTKERPDSDIDEQITLNSNSNSSKFNFRDEEGESTVLLNESNQGREIDETVLLEDDE